MPQASESEEIGELEYELDEVSSNRDQFKTATKIAAKHNTNRTYVQTAQKIKEKDPELLDKIIEGSTTFAEIKKCEDRKTEPQTKDEARPSPTCSTSFRLSLVKISQLCICPF